MRSKLYRYLMASTAIVIFPAGACADTALFRSSQESPTKTAVATRNACDRPDFPARITQAAPINVSRFDELRGGQYGSASVTVTLAADGRLLRAAMLRGSGNPRLDESALEAVRLSKFTPEQRSCGSVGGTYQVDADFTADAE